MGPHWQPVVGCLCLVLSAAYPAAVPTVDTMVVARSDNGETSTVPSEPSTVQPVAPVKLTAMDVTSRVTMRYAHTAVVASMRNAAPRAQEATFRVLLPETAFISSFTMILNGTSYKAYVKEKEEAKQIYNQAVSQGIGAAHVETKARDSNHFTVSVNIEPNTVAVFNLTYEELLVRRNGVYNHAVNLHPGALVPKLTVTVHIRETHQITELRVPEVRTGNEIDATAEDAQNSEVTIDRAKDKREATITFKPDLAEQQRLMAIYLEKTKETHVPSPYGFDDGEDETKDRESALGQFVVQYDVERPLNGEILVNDGYFVHFFAPSDLPPLRKHCVFVLDTSGSMMGRKIEQLRDAMQTILAELNSGDYFSIVEFASTVVVHDLKEADQKAEPQESYDPFSYGEPSRPTKLVRPSEATADSIAKAKVIVSRLRAAGGTNIYSALDVAVKLIQRGFGWRDENSTSGVTEEPFIPVTEPTDKEVPQLEPIIIFLTDGDPTVGQTDPTRIINHLTEKNSGMKKATIYSLAFGEDADRKFLRKLSLRNDGFMRHIYEAADAALQLRDFYRQVASPLLADVKFVYPKKQVKADSLTKHRFSRYYLGSEAVVAGRVAEEARELTPSVGAFCGVRDSGDRKYMEVMPQAPVPLARENFLPLERLWAYLTVKQLLDERDSRDPPRHDAEHADQDNADNADKRALEIALKYSFVTPLTSLVVVKPNATDAVNAESVDKQNQNYAFPGMLGPTRQDSMAYAAMARPAAFSNRNQLLALSRPHMAFGHMAAPSGLFSSAAAQSAAVALDAVDYNEEPEFDNLEAFVPPSTVRVVTSTQLATTASPLEAFQLQGYEWLSGLLSGDAIEVTTNATTIRLKLSKEAEAPRASADAECARAAGGGAGACVYLSRCAAARSLTALSYADVHCSVGAEGYAGVCCPKDKIDVEKKD